MNRWLLLAALLSTTLLSNPLKAQIYRWVDEQGVVHYSDKKARDRPVEAVDIKINSYRGVTLETATVKAAASPGRVVMYSTSWCGYCAKARQHFKANGTPYVEHDIEKDRQARQRYDGFGGKGVPVIFIGDARMNGFNAARFDQVYQP